MARLSKDALLGASDLRQEEVELETIDGSVLVQGLGAAYSNDAQTEATEVINRGRDTIVVVNVTKLEAIQILHGLVEPKLETIEEAEGFLRCCGPASQTLVEAIDNLSGLDKEAIKEAKARFPGSEKDEAGGAGSNGSSGGGSGPDLPARTGAGDGQERA